MARRRYLTTDISLDERVNDLAVEHGDFVALLYTWMIPHAEDDGVIYATPRRLLYMVMPMRRDKSEADIELALGWMASAGLIDWQPGDQQIAFPPDAFYRYQTYVKPEKRRESPEPETNDSAFGQATEEPREPATNTDDQRTSAENAAKRRKTPQNAASVSPSVSVSPSPSGAENGAAIQSEPWGLVEDVFEITGSDATQLGKRDRGKQCDTAKQLLGDHDRADLLACAGWLWSQDFWRSRGVDVMTVRDQMPRWISAGRPEVFATAQAPPKPVHLGPAYREFDPAEVP